MKTTGTILRILPWKKREVSGKKGLIFAFSADHKEIKGETIRTYNIVTGKGMSKSLLYSKLRQIGARNTRGLILLSPYLLAKSLAEQFTGKKVVLHLEESGNEKYPWNVVDFEVLDNNSKLAVTNPSLSGKNG